MSQRYLIIGGAPKSGTTSLFRYLADHPQVCPANRKETYFFARPFDFQKVAISPENRETFDTYFTHCSDGARWLLEGTPYTLYTKESAQKIKQLLPEAAVLFVLRDPVARLMSDYHFHQQREHPAGRGSPDEFVHRELETQGKLLDLGCYIKHLRPFLATFERSQIHILFFEELKANLPLEMSRLCLATGIDDQFYTSYQFSFHNPTLTVRFARLNQVIIRLEPMVARLRSRIMHYPPLYRLFEQIVQAGKRTHWAINNRGPIKKERLSPAAKIRLLDYYRPYNRQLAEALDCSLPWPDDSRIAENEGKAPEGDRVSLEGRSP